MLHNLHNSTGVLPAGWQREVSRPGGVSDVWPWRHQSVQYADGLHWVCRRTAYHWYVFFFLLRSVHLYFDWWLKFSLAFLISLHSTQLLIVSYITIFHTLYNKLPTLYKHTAFVNILPSLYEVGANMRENFNQWGQRRLRELTPAGEDLLICFWCYVCVQNCLCLSIVTTFAYLCCFLLHRLL